MIHKLIYDLAEDNAIEAKAEDVEIAQRALAWLERTYPGMKWYHELRIEGRIPETGGTLDVVAFDVATQHAVIVDWKGSLPQADSLQGATYAYNLWTMYPDCKRITVAFYNYLTGDSCETVYEEESDIERRILRTLDKQALVGKDRVRKANYGCSYCIHRATCKTASEDTVTDLSIPDPSALSLPAQLDMYAKLQAVMKRAEKIESALKASLMDAARAGSLPGYTVKWKNGSKLEWTDPAAAKAEVAKILNDNFADAEVTGLLPPSKVKAAIKAALGASYTAETERQMDLLITQNRYEILAKEKA